MEECPLCRNQARETTSKEEKNRDVHSFNCRTCGKIAVTSEALVEFRSFHRLRSERPKISAFTRERSVQDKPVLTITLDEFSEPSSHPTVSISGILKQFPHRLSERYDRTLRNLASLSSHPGKSLGIGTQDYALFFSEVTDTSIMLLLLKQLEQDGYITGVASAIPASVVVTLKGWNRIEELDRVRADSTQGFIAMWYGPALEAACEQGFEEAIRNAGYKPLRLDRREHNDRIDDLIIAEIRRSKFVVADLTENSNGVYFEAGLAIGLGLPVIWTVRDDHKDKIHFDIRQFNHIAWTDIDDLQTKLHNRIRATIV